MVTQVTRDDPLHNESVCRITETICSFVSFSVLKGNFYEWQETQLYRRDRAMEE